MMTEVINRSPKEIPNFESVLFADFEADISTDSYDFNPVAGVVKKIGRGEYTTEEIEKASRIYHETIDPDQESPAKDYYGIHRFAVVIDEEVSKMPEYMASKHTEIEAKLMKGAGGLALHALQAQFPNTF